MRHLRPGRRLHQCVCLLLAASTGCTAALWTPVGQTRAVQPEVAGVVRNYPRPGDRAIIVRYQAIGDGTPVDLVVPLGGDGRPVSPFGPTTQPSPFEQADASEVLVGKLTGAETDALTSKGSAVSVDRESLGRRLNTSDWTPVKQRPWRTSSFPEHPQAVCLLAYRYNSLGEIESVDVDTLVVKDKKTGAIKDQPIVPPAGTWLVEVPMTIDRPDGDRKRNVITAVALTPVAVPADAALVGVGIAVGGAICVVIGGAVVIASPFLIADAIGRAGHPSTPAPGGCPTAPADAQTVRAGGN